MTTATRPRLSQDFVKENNRRRLIDGFAKAVSSSDYASTSIADIVKAIGVARITFYDNFASKGAVADALVDAVLPDIDPLLPLTHPGSVGVVAIEVLSTWRIGGRDRAFVELESADGILRALDNTEPLAPTEAGSPEQSKLPPGRHGLPKEFVLTNQRGRLLDGFAWCVLTHGFAKTTIADVTEAAAVSRRTFYEHFDGTESVGHAVLAETGCVDLFKDEPLSSGIAQLATEVASALYVSDGSAGKRIQRGFDVLGAIRSAFDREAAAA